MADDHMTQSIEIHDLRTTPTLYLLIGGICGVIFLLAAFVALAKEPTLWPPTIGEGFILVLFLSWFATTRLTLTSDSIRYRSLLSRTDVPLTNILKVRFERGFIAFRYMPYLRVVITVREGAGKRDIILNAGLFDPKLVSRWIDIVNSKVACLRSSASEGPPRIGI